MRIIVEKALHMPNTRILFISSGFPGNASEVLWSKTAVEFAQQGFSVYASVRERGPLHRSIDDLRAAGIRIQLRPEQYSLWKRVWLYIPSRRKSKAALEIERLLRRGHPPRLVVFSNPYAYPPIELLELCVLGGLPFVTIANGNHESIWPEDQDAERYRKAFAVALRCYFVSKVNLRLAEKQLGVELLNAEVVWSQYNVDFNASPAWPLFSLEAELRLACVGRLEPVDKGQDILLEALASPLWKTRSWHLTFYGEGPRKNSLERLTARLGLSDRVTFAGYVAVEEIWSANHVLIIPSRHEGGPLTTVEAMLCGRPVVATDVGKNSEIIIDGQTGFLAAAPTIPILAEGLERLWTARADLENMGRRGAERIRELVPPNPARAFSEKIKSLIG